MVIQLTTFNTIPTQVQVLLRVINVVLISQLNMAFITAMFVSLIYVNHVDNQEFKTKILIMQFIWLDPNTENLSFYL